MSDVQSRERSPETASGAQREPDERVREALAVAAVQGRATAPHGTYQWCMFILAAALRRLQAAQREPHPQLRLYGRHRNDSEMMCESLKHSDYPCTCGFDAALAASKGTPDSMGHPRSRETAAESLSVDTSVADRKDAARYRWLLKRFWWDDEPGLNPSWTVRVFTPRHQQIPLHAAIDAAMSADVRSQGQDTKRDGNDQRREHDDTKSAALPEPTPETMNALAGVGARMFGDKEETR